MKILAFADLRTTHELPDVTPDVVLLLGDIPGKMVRRIDRTYSCIKLGVIGNHCQPSVFDDTKILNMHEKIINLQGYTFAGFEGSPRYNDKPYGQHSEGSAESFTYKVKSSNVDIFIAHSNPAYGDMELDETHRGFRSFNELILGGYIKDYFHGHLHEPFQKQIAGTSIHSVYPELFIELEDKGDI